MSAFYLGLDLGTSALKGLLCTHDGEILAIANEDLAVSRPQPGWSEQHPQDWWQACLSVCDALAAAHPDEMACLAGIGLSGQMHGAVLLDAAGAVLRPAILWNDLRASAECAELMAIYPHGFDEAGLAPSPGFTAPKLLWIAKNEPALFARVAKVVLPKDYLRYRLSGDIATDLSDASGTYWLDIGARNWSSGLLEATRLDLDQMPKLYEGTQPTGSLRPQLAQRWGVRQGEVPIAAGAGDNAAAACGMGILSAQKGLVSLGTSGVLFAPTPRFMPNGAEAVHSFCHALPQTWHHMGVVLAAGDSLSWLARLTGQPVAKLAQSAETVAEREEAEMFLPYLGGERTPHNNAAARGMFVGLSHQTGPAELAHAVIEGVSLALADSAFAMRRAGSHPEQWFAVGGGARSQLWLQFLADLLHADIAQVRDAGHGAALGAARLAICAQSGRPASAVMQPPDVSKWFRPKPHSSTRLAKRLARFRDLYPVAGASALGLRASDGEKLGRDR